jgi:hypothetical protein
LITMRRAGVVALALGLGLGVGAWPALANDKHGDWGWNGSSDDHGAAWGLNVAGDDGPAWGLTVTGHGPAWGVPVEEGDGFSLPVVLDGDGANWANGTSAFGIDGATITGDNPVADGYLGQPGFNSTDGWTNDRQGWLGGLLADEGWLAGSIF